ncbi:MAG: methyltransferase domain-containing protein [Bdellovibrionales bacterium]|nr:methyltransferase domain-containing protein [Bdellovibrionales bacterium]
MSTEKQKTVLVVLAPYSDAVRDLLAVQGKRDDLEILAYHTRTLLLELDTTRSYSVQTRTLEEGRWPYTRFDINNRLAAILGEWGAPLDVQHPEQILSVTLTPTEAFLGLSLARENLSDWAGGERRFKREPNQISRAEFKLLEALETFDLQLPTTGVALDMGAAPGGWTRLLSERGLRVIAVDPAELDPRAESHPNVTHIRTTVENYLPTRETFDVILNDMRMDARDSARVMLMAAQYLKPKGFGIMTLKLPEKGMGDVARAALRILGSGYSVLGARQLFHNRDEVTVALGG